MSLPLKPELERFVEELVKSGRFASRAEVVEAGLARLMLDPAADELDDQDISQIRTSLDEMRRGDVIDWKQHSTELRKKYDVM